MAVFTAYVLAALAEPAATMFGTAMDLVPGIGAGSVGATDLVAPTQVPSVGPDPGAAPGSPEGFPTDYAAARVVPVIADVTDAGAGIATIVIEASFSSSAGPWTGVFKRGAFVAGWALFSTVTPIVNGFRFSIRPDIGWPPSADGTTANVWLDIIAADRAGNVS